MIIQQHVINRKDSKTVSGCYWPNAHAEWEFVRACQYEQIREPNVSGVNKGHRK